MTPTERPETRMAMLLLQISGFLLAAICVWMGIRNLRGVPEQPGKSVEMWRPVLYLMLAAALAVSCVLMAIRH
jgi:hypothetical protein